jgi:hypothetical protein
MAASAEGGEVSCMRVPTQRRRLARRSAAVLLGLTLLAAPAAALANHDFWDVASANPFHAAISAMADAGITAGFSDHGFHPAEPVTRQAMAAFLYRSSSFAGRVANTATDNPSLVVAANVRTSGWTTVRTFHFTVPGVANEFSPKQWVYVQAKIAFRSSMDATEGCPCEFGGFIAHTETNSSTTYQRETISSTYASPLRYNFFVDGLFESAPGLNTFVVNVFLSDRANVTPAATFELDPQSSVVAYSFPFETGY